MSVVLLVVGMELAPAPASGGCKPSVTRFRGTEWS